MPGQLQGIFFKSVINSLLTGQILFPDIKERVDAMDPQIWYPWDDYKRMVNAIAERMPPLVVENIGMELITQSKEVFFAQGFTTPAAIFRDYRKVFDLNVRGAPLDEGAWTESFSSGHAVICQGAVQPKPLIHGYFRGFIQMMRCSVVAIETEERGGSYRTSLRWRE